MSEEIKNNAPEMTEQAMSEQTKIRLDKLLALQEAGVREISIAAECTMCNCHRFWSHRATKGIRGSQGAIIVCQEVVK